ncbi:OmpH family outer membrane protein [Desulfovibrio sp. OttesenSCG-928-G15]|nr:OmpH family outer membrane protein [Desulfovibrio sp. OttesenSCG-928-G15]
MRIFAVAAMALFFLSAPLALAADNFAFIDLKRVATECDAWKDVKKDLDKKFGARKDELQKERAELDKKLAQFQDKEPTAAEAEDIRRIEREYTDKAEAFLRLLQTDEARVRGNIDTILDRASKELAARKGLQIIFNVASAAYYDPKLDISDEMIAETNAQWKKFKPEATEK